MPMPTLPAVDAIDEEWKAFAALRCEELIPYIRQFILERFSYQPRYVKQRVWRTFGTVSVGIPRALGHPFHEHLDSDSTLTWTPIPRSLGH